MNQHLPDRFLGQGNINIGHISVQAPITSDKMVLIGHGNIVIQAHGVPDGTVQLEPQDVQKILQAIADGKVQEKALASVGIQPTIVTPGFPINDRGELNAAFTSPLGIPTPFAGNAEQLAKDFSSLDGYLRQLDQQFGGTLSGMNNGQQNLDLGDLLLQKGNLALWRFRQGALRLFAEQASLYALAEPQHSARPELQAFQAAARANLDVQRGWVLYQKYCTRQPALTDQDSISVLSQGRWQDVLDKWRGKPGFSLEQAQAEWSYLHTLGERYDRRAVQIAVKEAEWYFKESLRRQPNQSAALINLGALLGESALLAYIETGTPDRARLQQARTLFQRAHTLLDPRSDREGQIALAQCLLCEAISLPPDARLETVQWAISQAQQMRAALGPNAPGSVQWEMVQRNLAWRDFVDRKKIERALDILIGVGIGVGATVALFELAEQWLNDHSPHSEPVEEPHLPQHHLEHSSGSASGAPNPSHKPGESLGRHGKLATKAASKSVVRKVLSTTAGKLMAAALITALITTSAVSVTLVYHPLPIRVTDAHQVPPAGVVTEFIVPTPWGLPVRGGGPNEITAGPDGNLWFTEDNGDQIGRITPNGRITEFPLPISASPGRPFAITAGPDGNLWFTELNGNKIGRITPRGSITEFPVPTPSGELSGAPNAIIAGRDGNLWFTEANSSKVGRITPRGSITEFPIPLPSNVSSRVLTAITAGPDGNLWFTMSEGDQIGRITPNGRITEFPMPNAPNVIAVGRDGNLWFTENSGNNIGRITTSGSITEFPVPTPNGWPFAITAGPDGNLWFTEDASGKIGRITSGK